MKRLIQRTGLLLFGLFLGLLGAEVSIRFLYPTTPAFTQVDSHLGWIGRPNVSGTFYGADPTNTDVPRHPFLLNSLGMHDVEHTRDKPAGTYRVLVLGDSFVEAIQMPEADTSRAVLESCLNRKRTDRHYEVMIGGTNGWSTDQEVLFLEQEGLSFHPDLVVVYFLPYNDVNGNVAESDLGRVKPYFELQAGKLTLHDSLAPPQNSGALATTAGRKSSAWQPLDNFLSYHSLLYVALRGRYWKIAGARIEVNRVTDPISPAYYFQFKDFTELSAEMQGAWEVTSALFERLQSDATAAKARLGVVVVPAVFLADRQSWENLRRNYPNIQPDGWDADLAGRLTEDMLGTRQIPHLFLLKPLRDRADQIGGPVYFRLDGHWNVEGNRAVGESICAWLDSEILPPAQ